MFPSALPPYLHAAGAPQKALGLIIAAAVAGTLLTRPFAGLLLDKMSRRKFLIIALSVMLAASCGYYFLNILILLFALRFIHGVSWGAVSTASNTLVSDNIAKEHFAEGMGYFSLSASLGMALGPFAGLHFGVKTVSWLSAALMLIAVLLALRMRHHRHIQPASPVSKKAVLFEKKALPPAGIIFLMLSCYGVILTCLAIFSAQRNIKHVGLFFTVYAACTVFTRAFLGKFLDKYGFGAGIGPGGIFLSLSLVCISFADNLFMLMPAAVFFGIGISLVQTSLQSMAVSAVPKERRGAATAVYFMGYDAGIVFGSAFAGVLAAHAGYARTFLIMALLPAAGALLYTEARKYKVRIKKLIYPLIGE